jgi:hypothetical protein
MVATRGCGAEPAAPHWHVQQDRRKAILPNSAQVAGLIARAAAFSTTCVSAARLADTSSAYPASPTAAKTIAVSIPLRR